MKLLKQSLAWCFILTLVGITIFVCINNRNQLYIFSISTVLGFGLLWSLNQILK